MLITPFRVRLADPESKSGIREGYVGTVIGEDLVQAGEGKQAKVYLVVWYLVNEETGDERTGDQPTPSAHLPTELRAHVDPENWIEIEEDEDEQDEDEEYSASPSDVSPSTQLDA